MPIGFLRALRSIAVATLAAAVLAVSPAVTAAPKVLATTKPIHALVSAVMAGVAEPELLVKGAASAHTYSLRPSDARALEAAEILFLTGHGMELFLEDALETLAVEARVVALSDAPDIVLRPVREGGAFDAHADHEDDHGHEGHDHDEEAPDEHADMHYWLDPQNAALMVRHVAGVLAEADPGNAAAYTENAAAEMERLALLSAEIDVVLAPVRSQPIVVFHDAIQYFEARFSLHVAGSITVNPDVPPGAQRIAELREHLAELAAGCVFAEPQFEPAVVETIAEGTGARIGVLDPEGAGLEPGPGLYDALLRGLAASIVDCLSVRVP